MLLVNARASRGPYPPELRAILSVANARESSAWLSGWAGIRRGPTPLYELPGLATTLGVARILLKDESVRSDVGSFKALGAPIALVRWIRRVNPAQRIEPHALLAGACEPLLRNFTVISATDGNHGKGLAAAARSIGCRCVIVLHANVSVEREQAIARYGATIIRIDGNYDDSVREASRLAEVNGWHVVSDTSYEGYEHVPRDVMQGYATIAAEIVAAMPASPDSAPPFTHVFLQAGVGGLAAGIVSYFWEIYGEHRPQVVIVEPREADCLYQSAIQGVAAKATGSVDSIMAGLACGETSPLAWRFLVDSADIFMTVNDDDAMRAMRVLAHGNESDVPIVAGESGAAGLAGLDVAMKNPDDARRAGLGRDARVLLINTEGATAPTVYRRLVGEPAEAVLSRQHAFLARQADRAADASQSSPR